MKRTILLIVLLYLSGCGSNLAVMGAFQSSSAEPPTVIALDRLNAKEGELVQVAGLNLSSNIKVNVGGIETSLQIKSPSNGYFVMPKLSESNSIGATFYTQDKTNLGTFALLSSTESEPIAVIEADPSLICSDIIFQNNLGRLLKGLRNCRVNAAPCATTGEVGCITTEAFPSTAKSNPSLPRPPDCTTGNAIGCVSTTAFPSIEISQLTAGVLKNGFSINNVTGLYPSSLYPLPVNDGHTDLDSATLNIKLKSPASFAWFDRSGNRFSAVGNSNLDATNIKHNVSMFGSTGTYAPACAGDGSTNCFASGTLVAAETTNFDSYDIRWNKTIAGIAGARKQFISGARIASFNNSASTGSTNAATPDMYDSLDDWNNGGSFPSEMPAGFAPFSSTHWLRHASSDNGAGAGTPANGICDGSEVCLYTDRFTGSMWTADNGTGYSWENAITYCENATDGGYTDWRLPTFKEAMQAHINGIWTLATQLHLDSNFFYWTSTTNGGNLTEARKLYFDAGTAQKEGKGNSNHAVCIR